MVGGAAKWSKTQWEVFGILSAPLALAVCMTVQWDGRNCAQGTQRHGGAFVCNEARAVARLDLSHHTYL